MEDSLQRKKDNIINAPDIILTYINPLASGDYQEQEFLLWNRFSGTVQASCLCLELGHRT